MKKLILLALVLCSAATMLAQTNRMSYQAVVRNAANELVAEENLTVAISISDANGTSVYSETHNVTSNRNGVISLMIGEGSSQIGNMTSVDWRTAQIHTVITLPGGATLSNTTPVNAVPYAFYADSVDVQWVSDVVDDYLEHHSISSIVETDPTVPDWAKEANKPAYDYSEIGNTPTIPTVPTNVGDFYNDAGYITAAEVPAISVPTNVSDFYNDANYVTQMDLASAGYLTAETDPTVPDWAKEATKPAYDYSEIANTPDLSGYLTAETDPTVPDWAKEANKPAYDYSEIANTPDLSGYLTAETDPTVPDWAKEANKPAYDYSEIANTPDLSGYLTAETDPTVPDWAKEANKPTYDYSEIENTPTIPTVPTNVSAFDNDANYITAADIPAIPNNVSTFNNDANYITNSNTSCANSVDLCELLEKLQQLENQLEFKILTEGVTAVTQNSFTVNGKVQTDGSTTVTQRGFVYSSSNPTPSISDYRVNCGSGTGTYLYTVTGLTPGITYYVRAYATNENGTFYGSVVAVTTTATSPSTVPSVTTIAVTDVGKFRATVSGSVTSDGGENVTQRGFVYGTSSNPTTSNNKVTSGSGTGDFTILLSNLQAGTLYYVRAFAINSKGTAYGNQLTFNTTADEQPAPIGNDGQPCTGTPTVTDHEGNVYNTVKIGTQCWTKENMRATTSPTTGTYLIPPTGTTYTYSGKQARWYNNDSATYAPQNYGLLYNWNAAVDTFKMTYGETSVVPIYENYVVYVLFSGQRRGICPQGWHVPSDGEWSTLTNYLGNHENYYYYDDESYDVPVTNTSYVAKALASTQGWSNSTNTFAVGNKQSTNNASGFSAVPAGSCNGSSFTKAGEEANFWSSTQSEYNGYDAYRHSLNYSNASVRRSDDGTKNKNIGFSVRCLRDNDVTTFAATNITSTSATLNGNFSNTDNVTVTAQGFEWKTASGGSYTAVNVTGETMTYNLTGLTAFTSYTYRAFVTTAEGTSYGEAVNFTTLAAGGGTVEGDAIPCPSTPTVTDHEGNVYATVQIGNQCWMRDNLRTTTSPSTGTYLIPAAGTGGTYTGKQARWYDNDSATYAPMNYGLLYNWNAAVDTFNTAYGETSVNTNYSNAVLVSFTGRRRGICPAGWHLPSLAEWTALTNYVGSQSEYSCCNRSNCNIAKALASTEGWNTSSEPCAVGNGPSANNGTGFSAVPAGNCQYLFDDSNNVAEFNMSGLDACFWSSTKDTYFQSSAKVGIYLYYNFPYSSGGDSGMENGYSVRCLKD